MSKTTKSLTIAGESYPLFTNVDDVVDSSGHYMTATKDGTTYYLRLVKSTTNGQSVNVAVSTLGNKNFPNTTPTKTVTSGKLTLTDSTGVKYRLSTSALSTKGCDCDCTNCQDSKSTGSAESGTHVVSKYAECTATNTTTYGGSAGWVNNYAGGGYTTSNTGHAYGNYGFAECSYATTSGTYGNKGWVNNSNCQATKVSTSTESGTHIVSESHCNYYYQAGSGNVEKYGVYITWINTTNCVDNKRSYSNESGTHVVSKYAECTATNTTTYGGSAGWVNNYAGGGYTTSNTGHAYGNYAYDKTIVYATTAGAYGNIGWVSRSNCANSKNPYSTETATHVVPKGSSDSNYGFGYFSVNCSFANCKYSSSNTSGWGYNSTNTTGWTNRTVASKDYYVTSKGTVTGECTNYTYSDCYTYYNNCIVTKYYTECNKWFSDCMQNYKNCYVYYKDCNKYYNNCNKYYSDCRYFYNNCDRYYKDCLKNYSNCYVYYKDCNKYYNNCNKYWKLTGTSNECK